MNLWNSSKIAELFMGISFQVNLALGKLLLPETKFSKIDHLLSAIGKFMARECLMAHACILSGFRMIPRSSCGEEGVIPSKAGRKVILLRDV